MYQQIVSGKTHTDISVDTPSSVVFENSDAADNYKSSNALKDMKHGVGARYAEMVYTTPSGPNLPILAVKSEDAVDKGFYGGKGEAGHIGGFLVNDTQTYEPYVWDFMIRFLGVQTVLDVGCGRGVSTKWFLDHGVDAVCVEGSQDAYDNSLVPKERIVQHDFTRGAWWPEKIYDAVWCLEFLEHVKREHMDNYMKTFSKARYIFVSHAIVGGWHHVEVHHSWWWIEKFAAYGFEFAPELTRMLRVICPWNGDMWPGGTRKNTHFGFKGLVFRNRALLSPEGSRHLITGPGDMPERKRLYKNEAHYMSWIDQVGVAQVTPHQPYPIKFDYKKIYRNVISEP